jgi:endonuclease III
LIALFASLKSIGVISVLLSAQCTDKRVNEITPILFKEANNAKKNANVI